MKCRGFALAAAVAAALAAAPAWAQSNRTFVSGHGSDTNPCSLAAPCRSFAQAITQTNAGGEITILDPAGYGPVTITKAVSIINDGVGEAGVTATGNFAIAITIDAGPNDVVTLRGLTLVNSGFNALGIFFKAGGSMNVQNCVIRGFDSDGITVNPIGGTHNFQISDTIISNGGAGIDIETDGGSTLTAAFERVQAIDNQTEGFFFGSGDGNLQATAVDSLASGNGGDGFELFKGNGSVTNSTLLLFNSKAANNASGVEAFGGGNTVVLAQSSISGNSTGFTATNSGVIKSFGNNAITDTNNTGSLTAIGLQ